jgi:hypothetical protein
MRSRLRMAALAIAVGACWSPGTRAGDSPVENTVNLDLLITGLGRDGCTVAIKPGHAACQFKPVEKKVEPSASDGSLTLDTIIIAARSLGADRDCSFAITIKEPGRPPRTFRRGLRLALREPGQPAPVQGLKCYLNNAVLASKDDSTRKR